MIKENTVGEEAFKAEGSSEWETDDGGSDDSDGSDGG